MTQPTDTPRAAPADLSRAQFLSWYGAWQPLTVTDIVRLMEESQVRWWIAGGLAIDVASGSVREHDDIDMAVAAEDLPRLRAHLPHLQLWEAHEGTLTPLFPGNRLTPGREQLWARRDAGHPWLLDILLSPVDGDDWVFKTDYPIRMPYRTAIVHHDGVPYLAPEAVLLHKARLLRDKDRRDFDVTVDRLDATARNWLANALDVHLPGHEWRRRLD